jgi:hypothetical protein
MMGNFFEFEDFAQVRPIAEDRHDATMIGLEERHEHQHGKQLRLREISAGKPAGIGGKRPFGNLQGLPGQRHRRPRHRSCGIHPAGIVSS